MSPSLYNITQNKKRLKILILGPYRPKKALERLEKLRDCLTKKGFSAARLVEDFPDTVRFSDDLDEHFTIKSRKLIEGWANIPIFVFFRRADNLGVNSELIYSCVSLPRKTACCAVFFETSLDISSQIKGSIKIAKISYETFESHKELCNLAFGHSIKTLDRLFYYLE